MRYFIYVFLLSSILGCGNKQNTEKPITKDTLKFVNVCLVVKDISSNLCVIQKYSKRLLQEANNNDSCVSGMLDSLKELAIKTHEVKYLVALDSLCKVSDGWVSEEFDEISLQLFQRNFYSLFRYIYDKRDTLNNCLRGGIIMGYSYQLSATNDIQTEYMEIDGFINEQIRKNKLNSEEQKFLRVMQKQFNPDLVE